MQKKSKKKPLAKNKRLKIVVVIAIVILAVFVVPSLINTVVMELDRGPKPQGKFETKFPYKSAEYACSKPIGGEWEKSSMEGDPGYFFIPTNESDLEEYCRMEGVY